MAAELMARAVRAYLDQADEEPDVPPLPPQHDLTQTDLLRVITALLREAEVEVFELAMWQLWSRG